MSDEGEYEALPQRTNTKRHQRRRAEAGAVEVPTEQYAAVQAVPAAAAAACEQPEAQDHEQLIHQLDTLSIQHSALLTNRPVVQQQHLPTSIPDMPVYRSAAVGQYKFEYLDHTADVQLHAWGSTLQEAFEQVGLSMFNYMTPIDALGEDEACTRDISVSGHDLHSLLFAFLDELLFVYATEYIMMKHITVNNMDLDNFTITATGRGERFDRQRHESGTEVKAITYSAMQIRHGEQDAEVFVIVDI